MTQFTLSDQPTRIVNFGTSGEGDFLLVFIAQAMNPQDANDNFNAQNCNGCDIPTMGEFGGGGAYVQDVNGLTPSQRQTYDGLIIAESLVIPILIVVIVALIAIRRITKPTQFRQRTHSHENK